MSGNAASQGNGVRILCEHPTLIKPAMDEPASPHPLGLGIKNNYLLKVGQESVRLPKSAKGLTDLQETTAREIESLDQLYRQQAWRALLVSPKLLVPLADPQAAASHFGVMPEVDRGQTLRALAIGAVVRPPAALLTATGLVRHEPVAGVGCLFLVSDAKRIALRAWLRATWATSTRALCREVETLYLQLGLRLTGRRRRALLLAGPQRARTSDDPLIACAAVLGFDLTVARPSDDLAPPATLIQQHPPAVIMAERSTSVPPAVGDVVRAQGKEIHELPDDDQTLLLEEMRERLTKAAYLTPALTCRELPSQEQADDYLYQRKTPLPVSKKGQRFKHRRTGFVYEEDAHTGLFFTNDRSNHSHDRKDNPVEYKRFRATATALVWDADLDQDGQEIGEDVKHKSDRLKRIEWSELNAC